MAKTHVDRMLDSLTYSGPSRLRKAWLGFLATYSYTRAHDGMVINEHGDTISFGRWYSFCCAAQIFWEWLWRKDI